MDMELDFRIFPGDRGPLDPHLKSHTKIEDPGEDGVSSQYITTVFPVSNFFDETSWEHDSLPVSGAVRKQIV